MKQYLKDNFGLITVSIETTIRDLEDFLESAKDIDLKDSPQQAIRRTIDIYKDILSDLRTDSVTEIDEKGRVNVSRKALLPKPKKDHK